MTTEPNTTPEKYDVEVISQNKNLPLDDETALTNASQKQTMGQETQNLIEAIRTKAQSEAQKAGDFARDSYLDAVRKAREEIENLNIFDPERIENAIKQVQGEVEKDWDRLFKQANDLGERLNEAAQAAWEKLTAPRPQESESESDSPTDSNS